MNEERSPLAAHPAEGSSHAPAKKQLRVLIADDDRDMVATLAAILNDEGHQVREVYRGTEVMRLLEEFDPDVALVDIGMPGMSGYDVAREVRHRYGKLRPLLIAITGWRNRRIVFLPSWSASTITWPSPSRRTRCCRCSSRLLRAAQIRS